MLKHSQTRGQALVMITLGAVFMFAAVGLVVDLGWAYFRTEAVRAATDAAALAGAETALNNGGSGFNCNQNGISCASSDVQCSNPPNTTPPLSSADVACLYALQNGFSNGGEGYGVRRHETGATTTNNTQAVTFTCGTSSPPPTAPGACVDYWFTVRVHEQEVELFSAIFGQRFLNTSRRATAAIVGNGLGGCLYVMNPTADKALMSNGGTDLEIPCGIWVNSNASDAIFQTSGATINATPAEIQVVGGVKQTGHAVMTPSPTLGIAPFGDPLASMKTPSYSSACNYTNLKLTHSATLNPGTYCGGISIAGNDSSPVTFNPGLYVILGGGISMTGGTGATGTGVTFLLTGNGSYPYSGVKIDGSGEYSFSAPTSGSYESMLFIKDRTQPPAGGSMMTGGTSMSMTGIVYLPNESLTFAGNPSTTAYTTIVCDTFKIAGNSYLNSNYSSLGGCNPGPRYVKLVE